MLCFLRVLTPLSLCNTFCYPFITFLVLKSTLSESNIATPPPFFFISVSTWYFSLSLYFSSLCVLYSKQVTCKQHVVGSSSNNLCLFIVMFRPLMFKVIIDIVVLIPTVIVTVFYLSYHCFLLLFFVFHSFCAFYGLNWMFLFLFLSFLSVSIILVIFYFFKWLL